MDINWDRIARDADHSPRAVLLECLEEVEGADVLVVIVNRIDENGCDELRYWSSGSAVKAHALASYAARGLARHIDTGED